MEIGSMETDAFYPKKMETDASQKLNNLSIYMYK